MAVRFLRVRLRLPILRLLRLADHGSLLVGRRGRGRNLDLLVGDQECGLWLVLASVSLFVGVLLLDLDGGRKASNTDHSASIGADHDGSVLYLGTFFPSLLRTFSARVLSLA